MGSNFLIHCVLQSFIFVSISVQVGFVLMANYLAACNAADGYPSTSLKWTHQISIPPKPSPLVESKKKTLRSGVQAGQRSSPGPLSSDPRLTNAPHLPSALRVVM